MNVTACKRNAASQALMHSDGNNTTIYQMSQIKASLRYHGFDLLLTPLASAMSNLNLSSPDKPWHGAMVDLCTGRQEYTCDTWAKQKNYFSSLNRGPICFPLRCQSLD